MAVCAGSRPAKLATGIAEGLVSKPDSTRCRYATLSSGPCQHGGYGLLFTLNPLAEMRPVEIELPDWIDPEVWAGFVEMRKKKGHRFPFTEYAAKLIIAKLGRLKQEKQDPNAVLDQSTVNGWSGVFPVHDQASGLRNAVAGRPSAAESRRSKLDKMLGSKPPEDDVPY